MVGTGERRFLSERTPRSRTLGEGSPEVWSLAVPSGLPDVPSRSTWPGRKQSSGDCASKALEILSCEGGCCTALLCTSAEEATGVPLADDAGVARSACACGECCNRAGERSGVAALNRGAAPTIRGDCASACCDADTAPALGPASCRSWEARHASTAGGEVEWVFVALAERPLGENRENTSESHRQELPCRACRDDVEEAALS
jgi:hypothetical protein